MQFTTALPFATCCVLLSALQLTQGANILALMAFGSRSHKSVFMPIVVELGKRGHDVTFVNPHGGQETSNPGVRELVPVKSAEFFNNHVAPKFDGGHQNPFQFWGMVKFMTTPVCNIVYTDPEFLQLLGDKSKKYDLVIIDALFNECMLPLVHHFRAPLLYLSPCLPTPWTLDPIGAPSAFSYVPGTTGTYTNEMNLWQRLYNVGDALLHIYYRKYVVMPYWNDFVRKHLPETPDIREIEKNVSFVLTNTHPSITYQFPSNPSIVEVGAMHCKPPKPLPQDLEDFVSDSGQHGFIIISFGSVLRGVDIPAHVRDTFVKAFSRIPQRVIWKWETDKKIEGLSDNVRLVKWLPQQDLLGHAKIRAFITHGGLLSTQESVYHGCPLIGLPVFGDQVVNLAKAAKDGYAVHLTWDTLSEERIYEAIEKVVNDSSYSATVKRLSSFLKDQPETPVQRAIYWIEYVIRHRGAEHLRSPARNLNNIQIYMVDIILVVLTSVHVLTVAMLFSLSILYKRIYPKGAGNKLKSQ